MYYINSDNYYRDDLDNREVLVTVRCITYNHEKFIRDALEGFVMQRTNFRFEAIIHDDCSTDGTATIIREYAERYPSIIKPIFETENQYSKKDGSLNQIMSDHTRGKYIALCEGDDYWTDPLKLQKQVEFMETHPDYSMCFHNAIEHWEEGEKSDHLFADLERRDYDYRELGAGWRVPTASAVIRKEVLNSDLYKCAGMCKDFIYGDILIWLTAVEYGKVFCTGEVMSVYRRHIGGMTFTKSPDRAKQIIRHSQALPVVFGEKYKFSAIDTTVNISSGIYLNALKHHNFNTFIDYFLISLKYAPIQTCKKILSLMIYKTKHQ